MNHRARNGHARRRQRWAGRDVRQANRRCAWQWQWRRWARSSHAWQGQRGVNCRARDGHARQRRRLKNCQLAQQANHQRTRRGRLWAGVRGECDDGRIVTLALARRGEGDGRQIASTRREGNIRQVTDARNECEDAGKCKDGKIAGTGGRRGGRGYRQPRLARQWPTALCAPAATMAAAVRPWGGGVRAMLGTSHGM